MAETPVSLGTATNTASIVTSGAVPPNSRVFLFVWWFESGGTCTGATGGGLTWVVDHQFESANAAGNHLAILSADAPSGMSDGTTLTPTFSTAVDFGPGIAAAYAQDVAGGSSGYIDVIAADVDNFAEAWESGAMNSTLDGDLILSMSIVDTASTHTPSGDSTELHNEWQTEGTNRAVTEYILGVGGNYRTEGTWSGTVGFQSNIAIAYKAGAEVVPTVTRPEPSFVHVPLFPAGQKTKIVGQPSPILIGQSFLDFTGSNSWTHTPWKKPRGIIVGIVHGVVSTDVVTGVTYGGVAMTRVTTAADTVTEPGRVYIYFLGSGIPEGAQTVAVTKTGTDATTAWCLALDADGDTSVNTSGVVQENAANPSVTLGTGSTFDGFVFGIFYSGLANVNPPSIQDGVGLTRVLASSVGGRDFGAFVGAANYGEKKGANVVANFISATDDAAFAAVAIDVPRDAWIPEIVRLPTRRPPPPPIPAVTFVEYTDSATVYLDIQASGTEGIERTDSAEVYFDLNCGHPGVTVAPAVTPTANPNVGDLFTCDGGTWEQLDWAFSINQQSPVIYWKFDEQSGGTVADSSGNGRTGTHNNTPTLGVTALADRFAITYDSASGEYTEVADNSAYSIVANGGSIEIWATIPSTPGANQYIVAKGATSQWEWALIALNNGFVFFTTWDLTTGNTLVNGSFGAPTTGVPHFYVATISGTTLKTYIDGHLWATNTIPGTPADGTAVMRVGRRGDGSGSFSGTVDEFAMFSTALTIPQIQKHRDGGLTFQWQLSSDGSTGWADISGADTDEYVPVTSDETKFIRCRVTATSGNGFWTAESNVVGPLQAETADSATVYFDLQGSGTEQRESTDADTVLVDLQAIVTDEEHQTYDTAEVYLDVQVASTEVAEFVDANTVGLLLSPASTDIADFVDSNTVYNLLTPTSTDIHDAVDAAEVYVDVQVASSEVADFSDAATVYNDLEASGTDVYVPAANEDAAEIYLFLTPASTDIAEYTDSATAYFDLESSGTEFRETLETGEVYFDLQPASTDIADYVDAAETYFDLQVTSTEAAEFSDAAEAYVDIQVASTDVADYTEADTVYVDVQPASTDIADYIEVAEVYLDLEASGTDIHSQEGQDSATVPLDLEASGTDIQDIHDLAEVYLDITVASTDIREISDEATVPLDLVATGTDILEAVDTDSVYFDLQPASTDIADYTDLAQTYLDLQVFSETALGTTDTDTIRLLLTPASTDIADFIELATVYLDILPISVEAAEFVDSAQVYLDIQPGSIFVQVDMSLEIIGAILRWRIELPVTRRWEILAEVLRRWAVLDRRRFLWRS